MIAGVNFKKIMTLLENRQITRYSIVDAKRITKDESEYYDAKVLRFTNSVFDNIKKGGHPRMESIIKFMNLFNTEDIYDVIDLIDENGNIIKHSPDPRIRIIYRRYENNAVLRRVRNRKRR